MKVPLSWLKNYIEISHIPKEILVDELNTKVMEVEKFYDLHVTCQSLNTVVIGEVKKIHPLCDNYRKLIIDIGEKRLNLVATYDFNLLEGDKVAVAPIGTLLPSGIIVQPKELMGILSEGMLCAEKDLGIGEVFERPMKFPSEIPNGSHINELLELDDIIFEFDIEPNRTDLFSIYGFVRELGAIFDMPVKEVGLTTFDNLPKPTFKVILKPIPKIQKVGSPNLFEAFFPQQVESSINLCKRYACLIIEDIKVSPSPLWLQNRIRKAGIRPINNVVDLTNYVTLELGEPLHAFDLDKIKERIVIRGAEKGEKILTLDGKERVLEAEMCIIADSDGPIALGGIIGGEETAISNTTTKIMVEAANFNPRSIRKTSRALGLRTEASTRFEKGIPIELTCKALQRFAYLLNEIGNGRLKSFIDISPCPIERTQILVSMEKLNSLLGISLTQEETIKTLEKIEFLCKKIDAETIEITPPYFRQDINIQEDIIEEIGRLYGYNRIPYTFPSGELIPPKRNEGIFWKNMAKDLLIGYGMAEIQTTSFYGEKEITLFSMNKDLHLELDNPLSMDFKYMRVTLLPQMLFWTNENLKKFSQCSFFEIGKIYLQNVGDNQEFPAIEDEILSASFTSAIKFEDKRTDFYKAKTIVQILFDKMGLKNSHFKPLTHTPQREFGHILYEVNKIFHPYRTAVVFVDDEIIGIVGEIHPLFLEEIGIKYRVCIFDLNFQSLQKKATTERQYKEPSKFPVVKEDYSFIVDKDMLAGDLISAIYQTDQELVVNVELMDIYEGNQIEAGKKSMTFSVSFQSYHQTLTAEKLNVLRKTIVNAISKRFKAALRGTV